MKVLVTVRQDQVRYTSGSRGTSVSAGAQFAGTGAELSCEKSKSIEYEYSAFHEGSSALVCRSQSQQFLLSAERQYYVSIRMEDGSYLIKDKKEDSLLIVLDKLGIYAIHGETVRYGIGVHIVHWKSTMMLHTTEDNLGLGRIFSKFQLVSAISASNTEVKNGDVVHIQVKSRDKLVTADKGKKLLLKPLDKTKGQKWQVSVIGVPVDDSIYEGQSLCFSNDEFDKPYYLGFDGKTLTCDCKLNSYIRWNLFFA